VLPPALSTPVAAPAPSPSGPPPPPSKNSRQVPPPPPGMTEGYKLKVASWPKQGSIPQKGTESNCERSEIYFLRNLTDFFLQYGNQTFCYIRRALLIRISQFSGGIFTQMQAVIFSGFDVYGTK
jgi:hypothetical protein